MGFLGIDTSNYTSSAAILLDSGEILQKKSPLPVAEGAAGLRQSDAVFAHVKLLGPLIEAIFLDYGKMISQNAETITAVGVSVSPRDETGSYMPCFLAGKMCAESVAAVLGKPVYYFSHQAGHISAALYDTGLNELFGDEFIAFHISGGTTQCLLVSPDKTAEKPFIIRTIAQSLDLHAGQLIDRAGIMLGLPFPAGPHMEKLAENSEKSFPLKITMKGADCCLSGVENQCSALLERGEKPADVARFCIDSVGHAVLQMTECVVGMYPGRKLVYAGGVMSNSIIRESIKRRFDAAFANPAFSTDNAAGIAVLCQKTHSMKG